ncbi:DNA-binding protein [Pseudoduganella umbonata]|uniref:ATPase n=1 Tax=Pseudoduganella umbonata TaxID=864828 RepID=A0A4P8HN13_9BURK|nr:DNA-binding protein [Pseudoduganella umbonata]MBB3219738.1 hypothetical protein [Pseudoduganella umbonata]QCP09782.1 ATPase [Pseudoduganella umbonata]
MTLPIADKTAARSAEELLLDDIEALRARCASTQELYGEVCAVMFFRYGMTPTANRLYQLVRKGSMSAPADALARFWSQLRERSRVTIEGPDLPDSLRTGAGELLAAMWRQAQEAAGASLAVLREEAEARIAAAGQAEEAAAARIAALEVELATERAVSAAAREDVATLRHQFAASEALNAKLRQRIDDARKELNEQHAWFKTVERDHAATLDKVRVQLQAERDAADAARRHAAQALERERANADRLQQALDAERAAASGAAERHRVELREAQARLTELYQRIGVLDGGAAAASAERDRALDELAAARHALATAQAEAAAATGRAVALEAALRHAGDRPVPARPHTRLQAD